MVPRHIHSEPTSRLAIWARRIAGFALLASILAIIIVRSGLLEIWPALATFAGALGIAVVALLVAFAAFVVIWMEGLAGMGAALTAMALSLALLAYPAYLGLKAVPATVDLRHHHRSHRSATLRRPVAAAAARRQPDRLFRPLRRRTAAQGLSRRRAAGDQCHPAGRLRCRARGGEQTQVARRRCARPPGRAARGPYRGGGTHADHGLPR